MKKIISFILFTAFTFTTFLSLQTNSVTFASVGDFGHEDSGGAVAVSAMIHAWNPEFVVTTGDNCYYINFQMDRCVGQFYHDFIYPYNGTYGAGAAENKMFPSLGNHDHDAPLQAYLDFFTLPENERYYDFVRGPVHFFILDSDSREPDGRTPTLVQGQWLQERLAASTSAWNLVFFHHPPFSSGSVHGGQPIMDWPFAEWGADAVLAGHEHNYERILKNGIVYFVNGLGGRSRYDMWRNPPVDGSQVRYAAEYGAMLINADESQITYRFYRVDGGNGILIDQYTVLANAQTTPTRTPTRTKTATPSPIPGNLALGKPVTVSSFDNVNRTGNFAVDGNLGTRWSSVYTDNQWIRVDLGSSVDFNRIILRWETAYGKSYKIQISNDDINYTDIYTETNGNGEVDDFAVIGSARYIRMLGLTRGTQWGFSLWEFEVYGSTPTATPTVTNTPVPTATPTATPSMTPSVVPIETATPIGWSLICDGYVQVVPFDNDSLQVNCVQ